MLELRPNCENCNKKLTNDAMICTFECTFCSDCVSDILFNVCPNCGGGFEKRPIRPKVHLDTHPASSKVIHKPVDFSRFEGLRKANQHTLPKDR